MTKKKTGRKKKRYVWAVGRRKEVVATIRLFEKKGKWLVNKKPIEEYFCGRAAKNAYEKPLKTGECLDKFSADIVVRGGGISGQLDAVILATARALTKYNPSVYKLLMRKEGLLTVDSRTRERRKAGQMGRARKKKQSPKR